MKRNKRYKGKGILAVSLFAAAGILLFSFRNKSDEDPDMSGETADMIASFEKIDLSEEAIQETKVQFELEILEKEDTDKDRGKASFGRASSTALKAGASNLPKSKEAIWEMLLYNIPGYGHGEKELPESLRKLYVVNEEARDFVLAYDEKKNKHFKIDLTGEVTKGTVPALLQWDERWGYEKYDYFIHGVYGTFRRYFHASSRHGQTGRGKRLLCERKRIGLEYDEGPGQIFGLGFQKRYL